MPTRAWVILAVLVGTLGVAAALFFAWLSTSPEKVAETITSGPVRVLREPLRKTRGRTRLVLFALDGVGQGELREAWLDDPSSELRRLLGERIDDEVFEHGYAASDALSVLPSTTMGAWASIYTGHPPAETGVPGNEWFAREERRFYAPAPVSVAGMDDTLAMLEDGLLGNQVRVKTLFETLDLRTHVSLAPIYRGADVFTVPSAHTLVEMFGAVFEGITGQETVEMEAYREVDEGALESLIEAVEEHGLPDVQVVYFPGVDLYAHLADEALEGVKDYLKRTIDPAIRRVLDLYRDAGVLSDTYIVLVSDHGHTPVLNDNRHALGTDGETEPPRLLEHLGFRVRPFEHQLSEDEEDYQAVVAYQGAMAYVYLADRSTCPNEGELCDWSKPPRFEEDVLPVARAFYEVNRTGEPIAELEGTLDLVFARTPKPTTEDALPFEVFDGERPVALGRYLEGEPRPDLLALERRMHGLAAGPYGHRAGDVLLLAPSGLERPIEERYYFSAPYRSWHGSPSEQDSRIPLVVIRAGATGKELQEKVRRTVDGPPSQLDVAPLSVALLRGAEHAEEGR